MSTISKFLAQPPDGFSTQISSSTIAADALSIQLDSTSGLPTEGVGQLFKKDANGDLVAGSVEFVHWTNVSGNTITFTDTGDRGITGSDSAAQAYVADDYFEVWVSSYYTPYAGLVEHNTDGTHKSATVTTLKATAAEVATATSDVKIVTPLANANVSTSALTGWVPSTDTWTYASASTFTISGVDRTSVYTPGTLLKFTQTTAKYAVVASSSFSTDTTVSIIVNTDYVIANAAITSPFYSYSAGPQGFPAEFEFTPTTNGFSSAPTGQLAYYSTNGRQITVVYFENATGTSNATSYTKNLPVNCATLGTGVAFTSIAHGVTDNSAYLNTPTTVIVASGGSVATLQKAVGSVNWTSSGAKGCTNLSVSYLF